MAPEDKQANRRKILRIVGAGSVGLTGLANVAGASGNPDDPNATKAHEMRRAMEVFTGKTAIQTAMSETGKRLQEAFAKENINVPLEIEELTLVRVFPDDHDGVPTAHIVTEYDTGTENIRLHVLPQADYAFAYEETDNGVRRFDGNVDDGPTPAKSCGYNKYCEDRCCPNYTHGPTEECEPNCTKGYKVKEKCCQYPDGSVSCEIVDRWCDSDCSICGG